MVRKLILMSQPQSQQPSYHNRDSLNCQEKSQFSSPSDCSNCSIAASSSENSYTNSSSHPVTTMTNRPDSIDFEQISSNIMTGMCSNLKNNFYLIFKDKIHIFKQIKNQIKTINILIISKIELKIGLRFSLKNLYQLN